MTPPATTDTDLLIIGGGPAGCASAVMAASLGMRTTLIEAHSLCHRLRHVAVIDNVLGFTSGPAYADMITTDITRNPLIAVVHEQAARLDASDSSVTATLATGGILTAPYAVAATGVRPLRPDEAPWIDGPADLTAMPLWEASADDLRQVEPVVLGADRPLGTLLRTHPELPMSLVILHPDSDSYKADEVRDDRRVTLIVPDDGIVIDRAADGTLTAHATVAGDPRQWKAPILYTNIGNTAAVTIGALRSDATGYCPPDQQHPRIFTAGDLRSPRGQRIAIATGSGAEAALNAFYASRIGR